MAQQSFDPESPEPLSNQARNGLKAESGFTCYTDYLEAYKDRLPCHSWLANVLYRSKRFRITNKGLTSCDILDLVKNDHSQMSTPIRYRTSRGDKLLGAPRQAPEVACVQIVLWRVPKSAPIDVDLVDALGLGLKLDPQFFEALTVVHQLRRDGYEGEIRPFEPNHVVLGEMIATITNCYVSERSDTIPVILIADSHIRAHDHNGVIQIECREFPPFRQLDRPKSNHVSGNSLDGLPNAYTTLPTGLFGLCNESTLFINALLSTCLLALVLLCAFDLRILCRSTCNI